MVRCSGIPKKACIENKECKWVGKCIKESEPVVCKGVSKSVCDKMQNCEWKEGKCHDSVNQKKPNVVSEKPKVSDKMAIIPKKKVVRKKVQVNYETPKMTTAVAREKLKHIRLKMALRKTLSPILNKDAGKLEKRLRLHATIKSYFKDVPNCLTRKDNKILLGNKVDLTKQIGTPSVFGIVYLTEGKGFGKMLKVAVKVMKQTSENKSEINTLKKLSSMVESKSFINFPLTYYSKACNVVDAGDAVELLRKPYYVAINELASGDLKQWLHQGVHTNMEYLGALVQIYITLSKFQLGLGMIHNDSHWGNFLYHKVPPGGFWWYKFGKMDMYVRNMGELWVLWDFGLSYPHNKKCTLKKMSPVDVSRITLAFRNSPNGWMEQIRYPDNIAETASKLRSYFESGGIYNTFDFTKVLKIIQTHSAAKDIPWTFTKPDNVINKTPYVLDKNVA